MIEPAAGLPRPNPGSDGPAAAPICSVVPYPRTAARPKRRHTHFLPTALGTLPRAKRSQGEAVLGANRRVFASGFQQQPRV